VLALSRQNLPPLRTDIETNRSAAGGYRLVAATAPRRVVLVATGSEVSIAVEAAKLLEADGVGADVVSLPCWERFLAQAEAVRAALLPADVLKVSVEAGATFGWERIVGSDGLMLGIDSFGESGPGARVYEHFGLTGEAVAARVRARLG
jgi:transketolase